jgi:hypothetical protein
MNSDVNDFFF